MTERDVVDVDTDDAGEVTAIHCDDGVVTRDDAAEEIQLRTTAYVVPSADGRGVPIEVHYGPDGPILWANWDGSGKNNLPDLPHSR